LCIHEQHPIVSAIGDQERSRQCGARSHAPADVSDGGVQSVVPDGGVRIMISGEGAQCEHAEEGRDGDD
jgi:hypothetical protein